MENGWELSASRRHNGRRKPRWITLLATLAIAFTLAGCDAGEGTVQVETGDAPLAAAYRVDLYAQDGGNPLIEGQYALPGEPVVFEEVPKGRWAVLIQAQNGDQTTIAHYIGQIAVEANQVTDLVAGTYTPGLPGDALPESENSLASFGPDASALLTAVYAPGIDTLPAAAVSVGIQSGLGAAEVTAGEGANEGAAALGRQSADQVHGCATAWLAAHQDPDQIRPQTDTAAPPAADYGSLAPGATASFYIATTFKNVECARVLSDSQTEHCLIFAEVVNGSPVLDEATALGVARAFDSDNPFQDGDTGVYNSTRARVGSEWKTNPVGGRDGDERVILVFLSSQTIGGEGFFGFFRPQDEDARTTVPNSNEGEIIFVNADRANDDLYDALSTVSHEFTHLIMFNQKQGQNGTFPAGAQAENVTIDEGMAVLNEDLSGFSFTGSEGGNFFLLASVDALLDSGLNRSFFQFKGRLDDYGAGYLLCRYLHDRFGEPVMRQITTSTAVGRENIATVTKLPFAQTFVDFAQAVALNGEASLPPELSYTDLDLFATYPDREGQDFVFDGLQGVGQVTLPGDLQQSATVQPWGTIFYRALGGDGSALFFKATGVDSLVTDIFVSGAPSVEPTPTE